MTPTSTDQAARFAETTRWFPVRGAPTRYDRVGSFHRASRRSPIFDSVRTRSSRCPDPSTDQLAGGAYRGGMTHP